MSFDSPRSFADSFSAAPPSSHPLSLDATPPDFQGSSAYLLPPRDAPSHHRPFLPNPGPSARMHASNNFAIPAYIHDILASSSPSFRNPRNCPFVQRGVYLETVYAQADKQHKVVETRLKQANEKLGEIEEQLEYLTARASLRLLDSCVSLEGRELDSAKHEVLPSHTTPHIIFDDEMQENDLGSDFRAQLRKIADLGRTFSPQRIPCIPTPYRSVRSLPKDLRRAKTGHHGAVFDESNAIVPLGRFALMYICHQRKVEDNSNRIRNYAKNGSFLEIALQSRLSTDVMYFGSFKPILEWFPFTRETTGYLPELFALESFGDGYNNVQWYDFKLQWSNPASELRFCVFQYMGFNDGYFESLKDLAT